MQLSGEERETERERERATVKKRGEKSSFHHRRKPSSGRPKHRNRFSQRAQGESQSSV